VEAVDSNQSDNKPRHRVAFVAIVPINEVTIKLDYPDSGRHEYRCSKKPSECNCRNVRMIIARKIDCQRSPSKSGNWLLFPSNQAVDKIWEAIKNMLREGKLGNSCSVLPAGKRHSTNGAHLLNINTYNHEDIADVMRVLLNLRDEQSLKIVTNCQINYKSDEPTEKEINGVKFKPKWLTKYSSPCPQYPETRIELLFNNNHKRKQGVVAYRESTSEETIIYEPGKEQYK